MVDEERKRIVIAVIIIDAPLSVLQTTYSMALVRGRREEGDDEARLQNNERATGVGGGQCNNTDTTAPT